MNDDFITDIVTDRTYVVLVVALPIIPLRHDKSDELRVTGAKTAVSQAGSGRTPEAAITRANGPCLQHR